MESRFSAIQREGASELPIDILTSGEASTPYQYEPLNEAAQEIRLLTILPGESSAQIRVCLHNVPFPATRDSSLEFEALSYAWGDQDDPDELLIGETGSGAIKITQNLAEALPYLRYPDTPRIVWIDAICINQDDLEERSSQVLIMSGIYRAAEIVIVWLREEKDDSGLVFDLLENPKDWDSVMRSEVHEGFPIPDTNTCQSREAILNFLQRPYWQRVWIIQETLSATSIVVVCGLRKMAWKTLSDSINYPSSAVSMHPYSLWKAQCAGLPGSKLIVLPKSGAGYSLQELVQVCYECNSSCVDVRDKIYGLLSVSDKTRVSNTIIPDYSREVLYVYVQFFRDFVRMDGVVEPNKIQGRYHDLGKPLFTGNLQSLLDDPLWDHEYRSFYPESVLNCYPDQFYDWEELTFVNANTIPHISSTGSKFWEQRSE